MNVLAASAPSERGRTRWIVVALLFSAMVFNYFDRQMLALLKPALSSELHWSEIQYADMVFWFQAAYALAFLIWSIAQIAHGAVRDAAGFMTARALLGIGEGGAYPAGLTAVSQWFAPHERAFATGLINAGVNVGAIITPFLVPAILIAVGWRMAFVLTGAASLVWLGIWLMVYRNSDRRVRPNDGLDAEPSLSWLELLRIPETWAYALAKFIIDPIWWMFIFWLPDFLHKSYNLDLKSFGPPLVVLYLMSDLGNVAGGWTSSALIKAGLTVNAARKLTMIACAILALPVAFAMHAASLWQAVAIIGLAMSAHQAFSVNLFTLPSDLFPQRSIGSVVGFGGALGAVGGMMMARYAGWVLDGIGSYTPLFIVAASAYMVALIVIQLLSPRLAPIRW